MHMYALAPMRSQAYSADRPATGCLREHAAQEQRDERSLLAVYPRLTSNVRRQLVWRNTKRRQNDTQQALQTGTELQSPEWDWVCTELLRLLQQYPGARPCSTFESSVSVRRCVFIVVRTQAASGLRCCVALGFEYGHSE